MGIRSFLLSLVKGGPGSGCQGDNCGRPRGSGSGSGNRPSNGETNKPGTARKPYRSGVRPSEMYPHGRKPGGDTRTGNDPKPAPKDKPKR